jgi:hypothetical protein
MRKLPIDIKERFFKTIKGDISLDDFERWVYDSKNLETILDSDDYLDIISLDYKKSGAKYELYNILKRLIDIGEFETYKILELLNQAKQKDERLPFILMEFYNLYCKGYSFLQDLGLGYGLMVEVPPSKYSKDNWDELKEDEKQDLINSFYPEINEVIQRVIDWLTNKRIVLTGEQDEIGHYNYQDFRTEEDKKLILWTPVTDGLKLNAKPQWTEREKKPWWKIWV